MLDEVGADRGVVPTHLGLALDDDLAVVLAFDLVAEHETRRLPERILRQFLAHHPASLQIQAGIGGAFGGLGASRRGRRQRRQHQARGQYLQRRRDRRGLGVDRDLGAALTLGRVRFLGHGDRICEGQGRPDRQARPQADMGKARCAGGGRPAIGAPVESGPLSYDAAASTKRPDPKPGHPPP